MLRRNFLSGLSALLPTISWPVFNLAKPVVPKFDTGFHITRFEVLNKPFSKGQPPTRVYQVELSTGRTYEGCWDEEFEVPSCICLSDCTNVPEKYWMAEFDFMYGYVRTLIGSTEVRMQEKLLEVKAELDSLIRQNILDIYKKYNLELRIGFYNPVYSHELLAAISEKLNLVGYSLTGYIYFSGWDYANMQFERYKVSLNKYTVPKQMTGGFITTVSVEMR